MSEQQTTPITYKTIITKAVRDLNNIQTALANNNLVGITAPKPSDDETIITNLKTAEDMISAIGVLTTPAQSKTENNIVTISAGYLQNSISISPENFDTATEDDIDILLKDLGF